MINAYAAGLFDGEGCFVMYKASNGKKSRRRTSYFVANGVIEIREEHIVDALVNRYGGSKTKKLGRKANHSDTFRWKVGNASLLGFIDDVRPYLLIKHQQADLIKNFYRIRLGKATSPITDEELSAQTLIHENLKVLNQKGKIS